MFSIKFGSLGFNVITFGSNVLSICLNIFPKIVFYSFDDTSSQNYSDVL